MNCDASALCTTPVPTPHLAPGLPTRRAGHRTAKSVSGGRISPVPLLPRWMTASGVPVSTRRGTMGERVAAMSAQIRFDGGPDCRFKASMDRAALDELTKGDLIELL